MEVVKRCPKCGRVMISQLEYRFGQSYWNIIAFAAISVIALMKYDTLIEQR